MIAEGLWERKRRRDRHRSRRQRRACFGELVQMDTSIHGWTEGRGQAMVLTVMTDGATNRIAARFYRGETVLGHLDLLGRWLKRHGRPVALYTDKDSIYRHRTGDGAGSDAPTRFARALQELGTELILAHSPQAKGRVERFFQLAQDRWEKEMRPAGDRRGRRPPGPRDVRHDADRRGLAARPRAGGRTGAGDPGARGRNGDGDRDGGGQARGRRRSWLAAGGGRAEGKGSR